MHALLGSSSSPTSAASYNPTELCGYHDPGDDHPDTVAIRAAAKDFFLSGPLDVIEGHGSDPGPYEFDFDFAFILERPSSEAVLSSIACAQARSAM